MNRNTRVSKNIGNQTNIEQVKTKSIKISQIFK